MTVHFDWKSVFIILSVWWVLWIVSIAGLYAIARAIRSINITVTLPSRAPTPEMAALRRWCQDRDRERRGRRDTNGH